MFASRLFIQSLFRMLVIVSMLLGSAMPVLALPPAAPQSAAPQAPVEAPPAAPAALRGPSTTLDIGKLAPSFWRGGEYGVPGQPYTMTGQENYLNNPLSMTQLNGRLYVAESSGQRVLGYETGPEPVAPISIFGVPGNETVFSYPNDIAAYDGSLWVAEYGQIKRVNPATGEVLQTLSQYDNGGPQNLDCLRAITFDGSGNLLAAESCQHNRVMTLALAGTPPDMTLTYVEEFPANDPRDLLFADIGSGPITYISTSEGIMRCAGLTCDMLYIAEPWNGDDMAGMSFDSTGNRLLAARNSGDQWRRAILSCNSGGCTEWVKNNDIDGQRDLLSNPRDAALYNGSLLVLDHGTSTVKRFLTDTAYVTFAGTPGQRYWTDPASTTYYLNKPGGLTTDRDGNFYVIESEGNRLLKLAADGALLWAFGQPGVGGGDSFHLGCPAGQPDVDALGRVFVADPCNRRVVVLNPSGQFLAEIRGSDRFGNDARLDDPQGVAISPSGEIFIADRGGGALRVYDSHLFPRYSIPAMNPQALAFDGEVLYLAGGNQVQRLEWTGPAPQDWKADVFAGYMWRWPQNNRDTFRVGNPIGLAVDPLGRVYVVENWMNRITVFNRDGSYLTQLGTGNYDYTLTSLHFPLGVAFGLDGQLYVSEANLSRVIRFLPTANGLQQYGGFGGTHAGLAVNGTTLYTSAGYRALTFSWTNPAAPVLSARGETLRGEIVSMAYFNGALYVGNREPGLYVYDTSDPARLARTARIDPMGDDPEDLAVDSAGARLFAANVDAGLHAYDLTNPLLPVETGMYRPTRPDGNPESIVSAAIAGGPLFVARQFRYGGPWSGSLCAVDPTSLAELGCLDLGASLPYDLQAEGSRVYVAQGNEGLRIYDFGAGTFTPRGTFVPGASIRRLALDGALVYASSEGAPGTVYQLMVINPDAPLFLTSAPYSSGATLATAGPYVLALDSLNGVGIWNNADLSETGRAWDAPGVPTWVEGDGTQAYYYDGGTTVTAMNLTDPAAPAVTARYTLAGPSYNAHFSLGADYVMSFPDNGAGHFDFQMIRRSDPSVSFFTATTDSTFWAAQSGNLVVTAEGNDTCTGGGIRVYNADPAGFPVVTEAGAFSEGLPVLKVAVDGTTAYALTGLDCLATTLIAVDLSDPANPQKVGELGLVPTPNSYPYEMKLLNGRAYIAKIGGGLEVVDVSTPSGMTPLASETFGSLAVRNLFPVSVGGQTALYAASNNGLMVLDATPVTTVVFNGWQPLGPIGWTRSFAVNSPWITTSSSDPGALQFWHLPFDEFAVDVTGAGQQIESTGGVRLNLPAGSLPPSTVRIQPVAPFALPAAGAFSLAGQPFELAGLEAGVGQLQPVDPSAAYSLTVPYDPAVSAADAARLGLYTWETPGGWVRVPATVDTAAHTLSASPDHFSLWAVFLAPAGGGNAPINLSLSSAVVAEDTAVGATVGTLSATDPDAGDTHTFSLLTAGTPFEVSGNALQVAAPLDFETHPFWALRLRAVDSTGNGFEEDVLITVTDVNEAPTNLTLSNNRVANPFMGAEVGGLHADDPDFGETLTYEVISGAGFSISGTSLVVSAPFTPPAPVTVRVTDSAGHRLTETFYIYTVAQRTREDALKTGTLPLGWYPTRTFGVYGQPYLPNPIGQYLDEPGSLQVTTGGRIFLNERNGRRIIGLNPDGTGFFSTSINGPTELKKDPFGNIWYSDDWNGILILRPDGTLLQHLYGDTANPYWRFDCLRSLALNLDPSGNGTLYTGIGCGGAMYGGGQQVRDWAVTRNPDDTYNITVGGAKFGFGNEPVGLVTVGAALYMFDNNDVYDCSGPFCAPLPRGGGTEMRECTQSIATNGVDLLAVDSCWWPDGKIKRYDAGTGNWPAFLDSFGSQPQYIDFDGGGNLFYSTVDKRVLKRTWNGAGFDPAEPVAGTANVPYLTDAAHINNPYGLGIDADYNLYVSEQNGRRLLKFDPTGTLVGSLGQVGVAGTDPNQVQSLRGSIGIARDGLAYVADEWAQTVWIVDIATMTKLGFLNSPDNDGRFNRPRGVAIAPNGDIYVVDDGAGSIYVFNAAREPRGTINCANGLCTGDMRSIALAGNMRLYLSTGNNGGMVFSCARGDAVSMSWSCGPFINDNNWQYGVSDPDGLAVDRDGLLYVASRGARFVQVFQPDGLLVGTFGSGDSNFNDGTSRMNGIFQSPVMLALDAQGAVYVADSQAMTVEKFVPDVGPYQFESNTGGSSEYVAINGDTVITHLGSRLAVYDRADLETADPQPLYLSPVLPGPVTALAADGIDAYVAIGNVIQHFDVSNPLAPVMLSSCSVNTPGNWDWILAMSAGGGFVYATGQNQINGGYTVYQINMRSACWKQTLTLPNEYGWTRAIAAAGTTVYLGLWSNATNSPQVGVLDFSGPPALTRAYVLSLAPFAAPSALTVDSAAQVAYLGTNYIGWNGTENLNTNLFALDLTKDPTDPAFLIAHNSTECCDRSDALALSGGLLFQGIYNRGVRALTLAGTPAPLSEMGRYTTSSAVSALAAQGGRVYVAARQDGLLALSQSLFGSYVVLNRAGWARGVNLPRDLATLGDLLLVNEDGGHIDVLDARDPAAPLPVGRITPADGLAGMAAAPLPSGPVLFTLENGGEGATGGDRLKAYSLADPTRPVQTDTFFLERNPSNTLAVAEVGGRWYAYVVLNNQTSPYPAPARLQVFDVTDPAHITLVNPDAYHGFLSGAVRVVAQDGRLAVLQHSWAGPNTSRVYVFDLRADPVSPGLPLEIGPFLDSSNNERNPQDAAALGDVIYVGADDGLRLYSGLDGHMMARQNTFGQVYRLIVSPREDGRIIAYLSHNSEGISLADVTDPEKAVMLRRVFLPNSVDSLALKGATLFTSNVNAGLFSFISGPPVEKPAAGTASFPLSGAALETAPGVFAAPTDWMSVPLFMPNLPAAPAGWLASGWAMSLSARRSADERLMQPLQPFSFKVDTSTLRLGAITPGSLRLAYWDEAALAWVILPSSVDLAAKTVSAAPAVAAHVWALFGKQDSDLPDSASVIIDAGAAATATPNVTLALAATDPTSQIVQMRFSNDAATWTAWQPFAASRAWTLASGDGLKTVYAEFRDEAGNARQAADTILLDTTGPTSTGIAINGGAAFTNNPAVLVALNAVDALSTVKDVQLAATLEGLAGAPWTPYSDPVAFTLSGPAGTNTVFARFRDTLDNVSGVVSDSIVLDTAGPLASLSINGGSDYTNTTAVTLALAASDGAGYSDSVQMRFSNDGTTWSTWEPFAASKAWSLAAGDGVKTVLAQFKDALGATTPAQDSIVLDTTAPSGWIVLDGGATYAAAATVTAGLTAFDAGTGGIEMRLSGDGGATWTAWQPFAASQPVTLSGADGLKTASAQFRDALGNTSASFSDTILLDRAAPYNGAVTIQDAGAVTYTRGVLLTVSAVDDTSGVTQVKVSENAAFTGALWQPLVSPLAFTLSAGEGLKTVYVMFRDAAGNESAAASDTTTFTATPPGGGVLINAGAAYATSPSATLALSANGMAVTQMRIANQADLSGATWEPFFFSKPWTLAGTSGVNTVYAQFRNAAGDLSPVFSDTIFFDNTQPSGTLAINAGGAITNNPAVFLYVTPVETGSGLSEIRAASSPVGVFTATYVPYGAVLPFTLSGPDGTNTACVQIKDAAGNESLPICDTIYLDTTAPTGTISINSGAVGTNTFTVGLNLTSSGATEMRLSNSPDFSTGTGWTIPTTFTTWALPGTNGLKTVYYQLRDSAANLSPVYSYSILFDSTAPTGTVIINNGDASTATADVTLALTAFDAGIGGIQMRYSVDGGLTWTAYEPFAANKAVTLSGADGARTVAVQFKDALNNESGAAVDGITLDTNGPTTPAVTINGGDAYTAVRAALLTVSAADAVSGVSQVMVSENPAFTGATWQPYLSPLAFSLSAGEGTKTVYARFKDAAGNLSASASDTIVYDATPPGGGSVIINGGAVYTLTPTVNLALNASDAAAVRMFVGNTSDLSAVSPVAYAATLSGWTLTGGQGVNTVYVQFEDAAGNRTPVYSDSIFLDGLAPAGSMSINGGAVTSTSTSVWLHISPVENGSGVNQVRAAADETGLAAAVYAPYASPLAFSLAGGDGSKTACVQIKDAAGNESAALCDTILLDTAAPAGSLVIAGGAAGTASTGVTLALTSDDAAAQMRLSNAPDFSDGAGWTAFNAAPTWTLPGGDGLKTVYYQLRDPAGNLSPVYADSITLDTTAPAGSLAIHAAALYTAATSVTLDVTASDAGLGGIEMQFSPDGATWSGWTPLAATAPFTLAAPDGLKTIYARFRDALGNLSAPVSTTITLDTTGPTAALTLAGGATVTTTREILAGVSCTDTGSGPAQVVLSEAADFSGATARPYTSPLPFTLSAADGTKTVYLKCLDAAGNPGTTSATLSLDTTAPAGGIAFSGGAAYTRTAAVTLALTGSGAPTQMIVAETPDFAGRSWEPFAATKAWTLSGADGPRTVYAQFKDGAGLLSPVYAASIVLDSTVPAGTLYVNGGAALTNTTAVSLFTAAVENGSGLAQIRAATSAGGLPAATYVSFANPLAFSLSSGDGSKTACVQLKDAAGNESAAICDTITLDSTAPSGTLSINGGAAETRSEAVILTISAVDATTRVESMRVSNSEAGLATAAWQAYATSLPWTLLPGEGTRSVYIQFRDPAGNVSGVISDSILRPALVFLPMVRR